MTIALVFLALAHASRATAGDVKLGAYYFDGWTGETDSNHLPDRLRNEFGGREPTWGWYDHDPAVMKQEIDLAADAGLSFFSFCWYYPEGADKTTPLNHALSLYLQSPNRSRLGFCLMVANHGGFRIRPADWPTVTATWIRLFKEPGYVQASGKPLLIIFSPSGLLQEFGGPAATKLALDHLRADAKTAGLPGVTVAGCCLPGPANGWDDLASYEAAGFDAFTGYNYVGANKQGDAKSQHFADWMVGYSQIWDSFGKASTVPYIPPVAIGWDKRPWELTELPEEQTAVYYPDHSPALVQQFIQNAIQWIDAHPEKATPERLAIAYAWNENGEGGFLTPTKAEGNEYLESVKKALKNERRP